MGYVWSIYGRGFGEGVIGRCFLEVLDTIFKRKNADFFF
tara:strand:+ start:1306 stop:1422 length:117 start_codon:yes stop_codon:yes gene_type:complete